MRLLSRKQAHELEVFRTNMAALAERSELLDTTSGIGLWQAILHNGDALDPLSQWTWSSEFRRLIGYTGEADFPSVCQSWSDKLHPDDVAPTFAAFAHHLTDKSGALRYDVTYRLMTKSGSYRWFRASGGCRHSTNGTIRACGSLMDIHDQKVLTMKAEQDAIDDKIAIESLTAGLASMAAGNLRFRIDQNFSDKTQSLKNDFNGAVANLQETITVINGATAAITSGTGEITQASDDLSRRTEQQAATLEQTAAALDEITATVRKTAEGAQHARQVVAAAKSDAEKSSTVVGEAVVAMGQIEQSSNQISNIIGIIDEIAFQTNLLALNAGVEAARAGDAGRGFAVVASEVRALAQRSADAAKEIKALISTSGTQVAAGVNLVGATGKALQRIAEQIAEITAIVADITASTQEQATALNQVNTAVSQMDQVTQQNAAMVQQSTAASHALAQEADGLARLMAQFQIGEPAAAPAPQPQRRPKPAATLHPIRRKIPA